MLVVETQETIARFIGLFSVEDLDPKLRTKVDPASAQDEVIDPHRPIEIDDGHSGTGPASSVHNPHLRYANDHFEIVEAMSARLRADPIEVTLEPLHGHARLAPAPESPSLTPIADLVGREGLDGIGGELRDPVFAYRDMPSDSLYAIYRQASILDDRDTLILDPDHQPLDVVDAVSREFQAMVELGSATRSVPPLPHDTASMKGMLATSAYENRAEPSGDGPAGHDGVYVDGQPVAALPDLPALIEMLTGESSDETSSTLGTGSNLLRNEANVVSIADLGIVSVVKGDWHETNSIRQINLYADDDTLNGLDRSEIAAEATRSMNVAQFERIDATPGALPAAGAATTFPSHYQVDIIEGDLQITNFLSQVNFTLDGDRIVLGALHSQATIGTGGNDVANAANLLKMLGIYDLVIIGGDVFEGNFIQQMNILSDRDWIEAQGGGSGGSLHTGGNLLLNNASITNYGAIGDFSAMSPHMRDLVASFEARAAGGTADLGTDLAFLQSQNIKVLYIAGDVYEMNVVSQMNVLDDSDTLLMPNGLVAKFMDAAGPGATWSISTGHNGLVNNASIVDVDDASHLRFAGGEYYSDSMLLQAGLVSPDADLMTFDVNSLAPELIAFMTDLHAEDHGAGSQVQHHAQDGHADGVAGILA